MESGPLIVAKILISETTVLPKYPYLQYRVPQIWVFCNFEIVKIVCQLITILRHAQKKKETFNEFKTLVFLSLSEEQKVLLPMKPNCNTSPY